MKIFNYKVTFNFDGESVRKINWTPFLAGMAMVMVMQLATMAGFKPADLMSPLPKKVDAFDQIKPKLQEKVNEFKLKSSRSIVPVVQADSGPTSYDAAAAYAVVDLKSGDVVAEKNLDKSLPIASITKVMSAIVTLDLASPEELFTVTPEAAAVIPTKIGVVPYQKMSVDELLHAVLLTSANDAAEVLRDGIDAKYGKGTFIRAMNEKADYIGMNNSEFDNPQGFDSPNNYSSVGDLAVLSHYALTKYPQISEIVSKDYEHLAANEFHKMFDLYNWNGLIGVYPNVYGLKIGNTGRAGVTTTVAAERDGHRVLVVVLGTPDVLKRDMWAADLLDLGFEQFGLKAIAVTEDALRAKYATWTAWN